MTDDSTNPTRKSTPPTDETTNRTDENGPDSNTNTAGLSCPLIAVILAGGSGTRLFPASTPAKPKPLLALDDRNSLLERTVDRVDFVDETFVLTRPGLESDIRDLVPEVGILTEPVPKDTGPALVYAAARVREQVGESVMLCLPCDHLIDGDFAGTAKTAATVAARTDGLVTMGIKPDRAATEYGYIKPRESIPDGSESATIEGAPVEEFVEKPDDETARKYLQNEWYWNSGIFAWRPESLLSAASASELAPLVTAMEDGDSTAAFETIDAVSIDTAVLEDADTVFVVPADFDWTDIGSWDSLARALDADKSGNVSIGESTAIDSSNAILATDETVTAIGVSDIVVASFDGHTVVVPREQANRVSELVTDTERS